MAKAARHEANSPIFVVRLARLDGLMGNQKLYPEPLYLMSRCLSCGCTLAPKSVHHWFVDSQRLLSLSASF